MSDWPVWATEEVHVVPSDPAWQKRGAELCTRLDALLEPWLTAPVEHVGSTAVSAWTRSRSSTCRRWSPTWRAPSR